MEKYVISYDLAVKLEELGLNIESKHYHNLIDLVFATEFNVRPFAEGVDSFPAYMTDELLEMMPDILEVQDLDDWFFYYFKFSKFENKFFCEYEDRLYKEKDSAVEFESDKPCDALAKMLIWLIEQDYVKVGDLNEL